ncbi:hypothetical protein O6P43_035807 [Quillaja saponaria]|uniref:Uncharacterized protein n=1 Tax=Quillaja saponaria TaxID=32244 RepID=A0AAD7P3Z8_QUISA|nr:hypothetical protein O6P43_035807 [Quillaja saponaria]
MKNVAKCDTWCELQNPVNHRVFERKLRPRPSGRGHVCLGVTHRCPDPLRSPPPNWGVVEGVQGRTLASREPRLAAGPNKSPRWQAPRHAVVEYRDRGPSRAPAAVPGLPRPCRVARNAIEATPGQAGLPAEFKHINKRRKRNLQGFP